MVIFPLTTIVTPKSDTVASLTGTNWRWLLFVAQHKLEAGHCGSEKCFPQGARLFHWHCWNSTINHPSVVTAWSWGQNKSMSKEKATSYHALSLSWTVCRWHCVKRLLSHSIVLLRDWRRRWEGLMWPLQHPRPLVTWVGPPTSITQLSVSTTRQTYRGSCQVS